MNKALLTISMVFVTVWGYCQIQAKLQLVSAVLDKTTGQRYSKQVHTNSESRVTSDERNKLEGTILNELQDIFSGKSNLVDQALLSAPSQASSVDTLTAPKSSTITSAHYDAPNGTFESADCGNITGWAVDMAHLNDPMSVDVYLDGVFITSVLANQYRDDLAKVLHDKGLHGFKLVLPQSTRALLTGTHSIDLTYGGTRQSLTRSPLSITCLASADTTTSLPASSTTTSPVTTTPPTTTITSPVTTTPPTSTTTTSPATVTTPTTTTATPPVAVNTPSSTTSSTATAPTTTTAVANTNRYDAPNGTFESADCSRLSGWAVDMAHVNNPMNVDVYVDGVLTATVAVNQYRDDLAKALHDKGLHGFSFAPTLSAGTHQINLTYGGTQQPLTGSPLKVTCTSNTTTAPVTPPVSVTTTPPVAVTPPTSATVSPPLIVTSPVATTPSTSPTNTCPTNFYILSDQPNLCAGQSVILTASGCTNGTVTWNTGAKGLTLTTTKGGLYTATCVQQSCSTVSSTVSLNCPSEVTGTFNGLPDKARPKDGKSFLDNGLVRIGIDLNGYGGAITYFAQSGKPNMVNNDDVGRQVQSAIYSGPVPFSQNGQQPTSIGWNPVEAGSIYQNVSKVIAFSNDGTTIYTKSIPLQWGLYNVPGEAYMEKWISLDGKAARVHVRWSMFRSDQSHYEAREQEFPCVYAVGTFTNFKGYTGSQPFTNDPIQNLTEPDPDAPYTSATENWLALVNAQGDAFGLWSKQGRTHFNRKHFQNSEVGNGEFNYHSYYIALAPVEVVDYNGVIDYDFAVIGGSVEDVRQYAYAQARPTTLPEFVFTNNRLGWYYQAASDTGIPNKELVITTSSTDRNVKIFAPDAFYQAADISKIYIKAAFKLNNVNRLALGWLKLDETTYHPGSNRQKEFAIINDGKYRVYEIDLTNANGWDGSIVQLLLSATESDRSNLSMPGPGGQIKIQWVSYRNLDGSSRQSAEEEAAIIYPNPAQNKVLVQYKLDHESAVQVNVMTLTGLARAHAQQTGHAGLNEIEVDISDCPLGELVVELIDDKQKRYYKLMKQ